MVMADRDWPVTVPISVEIGNLVRSHMDMSRVMIVICFDQSDSGLVGCMGEVVLRLRQAVQVHGRQEGDAQTDAEVAKGVWQRFGLHGPCNFQRGLWQWRQGYCQPNWSGETCGPRPPRGRGKRRRMSEELRDQRRQRHYSVSAENPEIGVDPRLNEFGLQCPPG